MSHCRLPTVLKLICLATLSLALSLVPTLWPSAPPAVQASEPTQRVQQGIDAYQAGQYAAAIAHWQAALTAYPPDSAPEDRAILLQNVAQAYQQTGQFPEALAQWQQALALYQSASRVDKLAPVLAEQAQVYVYLGQPREAIALLCGETDSPTCEAGTAIALAAATGDLHTQVAALGTLGEAYRALQNFDRALAYAEGQGLDRATALAAPQLIAALHGSIGYTHSQHARENYLRANATAQRGARQGARRFYEAAWRQDQLAQAHLQESLLRFRQMGDPQGEAQVLMGLYDVLTRPGETAAGEAVLRQAAALWETLPDNRGKVSLALRLVKRSQPLVATGGADGTPLTVRDSRSSLSLCQDIVTTPQSQQLLEAAVALAKSLENTRLQSFTLGDLGHLYECRQDYPAALAYTQAARVAANDALLALDGLHLWQWQAGRLYQALGQPEQAIAAYQQATDTLETVRSQILATTQNLQFDFRDAVTPVYRELADLQLAQIPPEQLVDSNTATGRAFSHALGNIDALQLAELQNYFGSDCVIPIAAQRIDEAPEAGDRPPPPVQTESAALPEAARSPLGDSAALISTIILPEKTAVTLTLPTGQKYLHWIEEDENTLRQATLTLIRELQDWLELDFDLTRSQQMYDRLIRPFEPILANAAAIDTLVFVNDGLFRGLPMAALHSGSEYLVERYAIATAPFLSLTPPQQTDVNDLTALFVGVTQSSEVGGRSFPALDFVAQEAQRVKARLPATTLLLDTDLATGQRPLKAALTDKLQVAPYSILHIATHGKFEAEAEKSFLVLGSDSTLTIGELDGLLRAVSPNTDPLELMVLSACQTATGDDRASLGLAGVTIRAGANSALATLWSVGDATTADLIDGFYQGLVQAGLPKAKALQQAQKRIIDTMGRQQSPGIWAPFTLIGSWL